MKTQQFIHTYKKHHGRKQPIITTALKLDQTEDGKIRGLGIGFSYCSIDDQPNKKIGRMIAMSRAKQIIEEKEIRQVKQSGESSDSYHIHSLYVSLPIENPNKLEVLPMPEDSNVYS